MSRNALNLNFNKLQYEDFTSCIFTFIILDPKPSFGPENRSSTPVVVVVHK